MLSNSRWTRGVTGVYYMRMKKDDAIALHGGRPVDLARGLGVTRQYITKFPDELPQYLADRVVGAAVRRGIIKLRMSAEERAKNGIE